MYGGGREGRRDRIILAGGLLGILVGFGVKRNGADEARHFLAEASALLPVSPDILFSHPFSFPSAVSPCPQYSSQRTLLVQREQK